MHDGNQLTWVVMPPGGTAWLDDDMANHDVGPALISDLDRVVGRALASTVPLTPDPGVADAAVGTMATVAYTAISTAFSA